MGSFVMIGAALLIGSWAFRAGKQDGSRKAFHAGREQAKRLWRR
jgi:hypothetical protein